MIEKVNIKIEKYDVWVDEIIGDTAIICWHVFMDKYITLSDLKKVANIVLKSMPDINIVCTHWGIFKRITN